MWYLSTCLSIRYLAHNVPVLSLRSLPEGTSMGMPFWLAYYINSSMFRHSHLAARQGQSTLWAKLTSSYVQ